MSTTRDWFHHSRDAQLAMAKKWVIILTDKGPGCTAHGSEREVSRSTALTFPGLPVKSVRPYPQYTIPAIPFPI
jgi:hypothetical protein